MWQDEQSSGCQNYRFVVVVLIIVGVVVAAQKIRGLVVVVFIIVGVVVAAQNYRSCGCCIDYCWCCCGCPKLQVLCLLY